MIIIGIDPGTATMGFGVIEKQGKKIKHIDHGVIKTSPELAPAERLKILYNEINSLIKKYNPDFLAVEKIFFFKNAKTVISVAQAKGVILLAAAKKNIPIMEFTPLQVKMTIVGYGRADKKQVQKMIEILLNLKEIPRPDDAADALGVAICCARELK
ncbi:MAG: crossover junction endodeoxyribonuclease RuvC [Candidatus Pacebacteria bacterium]|nr:crossover junction endodeoxyribonuclease RuvC [Candidatus Paceibacterota bacterium]